MEVHHHSHTARKKWTHYFWEFFMLFLAVTLGFLVENWREHSIEHKRAIEYAGMLKMDLMTDTLQLKRLVDKKDSMIKEYDWLIRYYSTPSEKITIAQWDSTDNHGIDLSQFISNDATYSLLKSSGNLRYFNDTALIRRLVQYESQLKSLKDFTNTISSLYGGLGSGHMLASTIAGKNFLAKKNLFSPSTLLKDAGYNFISWNESAEIIMIHMRSIQSMYTDFYPMLKQTATEIIVLLNEKYHLK